jgi:hypothetical protein
VTDETLDGNHKNSMYQSIPGEKATFASFKSSKQNSGALKTPSSLQNKHEIVERN